VHPSRRRVRREPSAPGREYNRVRRRHPPPEDRPIAATPPECRRLQALVDRDLDRELTPDQAAFVRTHLGDCAACRDRHDFQRRIRAAIDAALRAEAVPPALTARLMRRLDELEAAGG
jgi:anti-sigma factor (TIGR02949 family)